MKKSGFTLSELIIALGIVGVIAAITAPMITSIVPDKDKVNTLNAYKLIQDTSKEILRDPSLYHCNGDTSANILTCNEKPFDVPDAYISKMTSSYSRKFPVLFAWKLGVNADDMTWNSSKGMTFKTNDGTYWEINCNSSSGATFVLDFNGTNEGKNCSYHKTSCQKPDRFTFELGIDGMTVQGKDNLTKAYIKNPFKLNDKKEDYKTAKSL